MESLKSHLPTPASLEVGGGDFSTPTAGRIPAGEVLDDISLERGRRLARRLLGALAPLLPVVGAATKDQVGAAAWLEAWGRQIAHAGLTGEGLARALSRLGELDRSRPFDWPAFLALTEPSDTDLQSSMLRVLSALSSGDLSSCTRQELWVMRNYPGGSWALRTESASDSQRKRWRALLTEAHRLPADSLPQAVEKPAGLLARRLTEEERLRGREALAKLRAMLAHPELPDETK